MSLDDGHVARVGARERVAVLSTVRARPPAPFSTRRQLGGSFRSRAVSSPSRVRVPFDVARRALPKSVFGGGAALRCLECFRHIAAHAHPITVLQPEPVSFERR